MFLTVSRSASTIALSAPSSMISPSLSMVSFWISATLAVRSLSAFWFCEASSAGPCAASVALWACSCRLAASRGMSCPEKSIMTPPRWRNKKPEPDELQIAIAAITAKAANRLPLTPKRGRRNPKNLPIPHRKAMPNAPSRYQSTKAAEVSRYPVKKSGILKLSAQSLSNKRKRGRRWAGLSVECVNAWLEHDPEKCVAVFRKDHAQLESSVVRSDRVAPVEAVVHAGRDGVVIGAEAAGRTQARGRGEGRVAEIVILVLGLGRPVRGEHVFDAEAGGPAIAVVAIGREGDRRASNRRRHALAVVGIGVAALHIEQTRTPGVAH